MASLTEALHGAVSPEELTLLTGLISRSEYDAGFETVTVGALSVTKKYSKLSIDGTKAFTLANGTYIGQVKVIFVSVAANTPAGTLTPASFDVGTSIAFDAVNDSATLVWDGTNWLPIVLVGVAVS